MRGKVISRFAAGTFSVCLIYSLVSQALNTESSAQEAVTAWLVTPAAVVEPEESEIDSKKTQEEQLFFPQEENNQDSSRGYPGSDSSEYQSFRGGKHGGKGGGRHGRGGYESSESTGNYSPDTWYGNASSAQKEEPSVSRSESDSTSVQQETPSGDAPTLQQFLSMMRCSGCRHNCSLLSPRCMKGRSKAQNAVVQYQQTYPVGDENAFYG